MKQSSQKQAQAAVQHAISMVPQATGYKSELGRPSLFQQVLEEHLVRSRATLIQSVDPRGIVHDRKLPKAGEVASVFRMPDKSVVAVFEHKAETAAHENDIIYYAGGAGYAGAWDGNDVRDLDAVLREAWERVNGDRPMDPLAIQKLFVIPHADLIPEKHPLKDLATVIAADRSGDFLVGVSDDLLSISWNEASLIAGLQSVKTLKLSSTLLGGGSDVDYSEHEAFYEDALALVTQTAAKHRRTAKVG